MKRALLFLSLIIGVKIANCQKEINLGIDKESIGVTPYLFSINSTNDNKILVKYLCFPPCLVKSDDESTMNGVVITANKSGLIKGGVELSDAAMILITHLVDPAAATFSLVQKDIIAIRNVDQSKAYFISLDGVDNKCKHIYERKEVPYNKGNLSTIKNVSVDELKSLEKVLSTFNGRTSARNFVPSNSSLQNVAQVGQDEYVNNLSFKLPDDEKIQRNRFLDLGIDYLLTRDKRVKKDVGVAYKTYFIYPQNVLVKCDSVFYGDKSDDDLPERVFNIDKNKFTGIITRYSSEPLQSNVKLNYFRYNYIDIDKSVKRVRFQTENGKLNSFSPERSFKSGDTIIHLTRRKGDYCSSIFFNDTIKQRYPLSDRDTLKFNSLTCDNVPVGSRNLFGFDVSIFMNEKVNDLFLIGEQSTLTKSGAGLVPMEHPEAGVKGYALTKLYVIKNNGVRSINRIMVPNFSKEVSTYTLIKNDKDQTVFLINLTSPIFLIIDNKGNLRLKDAGRPGYEKIDSELTNQSIFQLDGVKYQLLKETKTGKLKLIPFQYN